MKKLNRRGYMTIEIIMASVITFVIAFFLIDITMKLSSNTDDEYSDTVLITDKALIIKNIKEYLKNDICNNGEIREVICNNINKCEIYFQNSSGESDERQIYIDGNIVRYMNLDEENIYEKKIDSGLSDITLTSNNNGDYYNFKISGTNIFVDKNYDMNIFVYNKCE